MTAVTSPTRSPGPGTRAPETPSFPWQRIDVLVVACVAALGTIGVAAIYSSTNRALVEAGDDPMFFARRQMIFLAAGAAAALVTWLIDHRMFAQWSPMLYLVTIGLLLAVLVVGVEVNGAKSWFQLPGFQFQPSEAGKLALIVVLARFLAASEDLVQGWRFVLGLAIAGLPALLILAQPDLGTVLVYVAIVMGTFLVGGARLRDIALATMAGVGAVSIVLGLGLLPEAQSARITSFLDDDAPPAYRYNAEQAEIAVGSGGLTGQGYLQGSQTTFDFVPEQHTDFVFTAIAEEFGFVGSATVLVLFGVLIWRLLRIAVRAEDRLGAILVAGVISMLLFQLFQNVGMAAGIMPITGLPLPFVSHGGSSTVAACAAVGLALNVGSRRTG